MIKVAVVTGSNTGIGFSVVKMLCQKFDGVVCLTSRNEKRGLEAVEELNKNGLYPEFFQLDVADKTSVEKFRDKVMEKLGGIDILINNAGIVDTPYIDNTSEDCQKVIEINFYGLLNMQDIVYPIVKKGGRILNVSSVCGHLSNIKNINWINKLLKKDLSIDDIKDFVQCFLDAKKFGNLKKEDFGDASVVSYKISKIAVNALTPIQQKILEARDISINSVYPGLVRSKMTGGSGFYTTDEAAEILLFVVLEAPKSLRGQFVWYDRSIVDWSDYKTNYSFNVAELDEYK